MKKLNLISASIVALFAAASAQAGTISATATKIATENFGGSTSAATDAVLVGGLTYNLSSITAVNSGSTIYFTVRLTGGKFAATPAYGNFTFAGQQCSSQAAASNPLCVVTPSTDRSTIKVAVTTGASYTLGLGAFAWTAPQAADVDSVNTNLATAGNTVTATVGLVTANPSSFEAADAQTTIDAPLATGTLAQSASAIGGTAGSLASYTGKIDLTVSPAASKFTTTNADNVNYAILGTYKFTDAGNSAKIRSGASNYTMANGSGGAANSGAVVTVSLVSGAFPIGSVLSLNTAATCTTATTIAGSSSAAVTSATASTSKTLTSATTLTTGTDYYVCITAPSSGNTAAPFQASVSAQLTPASTKDSVAAISGTGNSLQYNGSTVDVQTYWPGALTSANFTGYLRITNTGSVAAAISGQHYTTAGALTGTAQVLAVPGKLPTGTLAAGQSVLLSSQQIDAILGAAPSGYESGRIRITAPTDGLRIQSLLQAGTTGNLIEYNNKVSSGNQQ